MGAGCESSHLRRGGLRYLGRDDGAAFRPVTGLYPAAVRADDEVDDGQAEAGAAVRGAAGGIGTAEPLERAWQEVIGEPGPVVLHAQHDPAGEPRHADPDRPMPRAVPQRVVD